jgi:HlyD family secretion protein
VRAPKKHSCRWLFAAANLVILLGACTDTTQAPAQRAGLQVSVIEVKSSSHAQRLDLSGQIVAREQVRITAEIDNLRIIRVWADAGQHVNEGTVLVELDSAVMNTEYAQAQQQRLSAAAALTQAIAQQAQAQSAARMATADAQRYEAVAQIGAVSEQDTAARHNAAEQAQDGLTVAKANIRAAIAQRDIAQSALNLALQRRTRLKIRAPIAGTLSERKAELGSIVTMSDAPLFMLMPDGAREFEAELDLDQLENLPVGAVADVEIAQFPQIFKARLRTRAVNVRATDRRGPVRFELLGTDQISRTQNDQQVPIGASASAHLTLAGKISLSLPPSAVLFDPDPWVYVVDKNQRVQRRNVRLSSASQERLLVQSGLEQGAWVVASAATLLSPGALIRPVLTDFTVVNNSAVAGTTDIARR